MSSVSIRGIQLCALVPLDIKVVDCLPLNVLILSWIHIECLLSYIIYYTFRYTDNTISMVPYMSCLLVMNGKGLL